MSLIDTDTAILGSKLEARNVVMNFGGVQALTGTSIEVAPGKITSLIGPNGAGKTTLFNIVGGFQTPTSGKVFLNDIDITTKSASKRSRMGIARTFQKLEAFNTLSTRDNVLVAAEMLRQRDIDPKLAAKDVGHTHLLSRNIAKSQQIQEDVNTLIEEVGLSDVADITVATLPTGTARLVELARALATKPTILMLDEPSSGLDERETEEMADLLTRLVKQGLTVLLVEHDMSFVMGVSEFIYVLDFGTIIAQDIPDNIQANPQVRAAYLGSH